MWEIGVGGYLIDSITLLCDECSWINYSKIPLPASFDLEANNPAKSCLDLVNSRFM